VNVTAGQAVYKRAGTRIPFEVCEMVGKDKNPRRVEGKAMTRRIRRAGFMFALALLLMTEMRRTLMLLFSTAAALLLASGAVLALPSEKPDITPMVDGRVRAIEQVGTNVWLGGRISQVKRRDGILIRAPLAGFPVGGALPQKEAWVLRATRRG
jgi:hypothetical protein